MVTELGGKRLELLKEALPHVSRVAVLWNAGNPASPDELRAIETAARALGLQLHSLAVRHPDELDSVFAAMTRDGAEALIALADGVFWSHRTRVVALAAEHRLPAVFDAREFADAGSLMTYGPHVPDNYRRAAVYVDKILKGTKPADLPVEQPVKFELVINLKTAKAHGYIRGASPRLIVDDRASAAPIPYAPEVFQERQYYVPLHEVLVQSRELSQERLVSFVRAAVDHLSGRRSHVPQDRNDA
jgi:ABC transporter substrate binding protein